MTRPQWQLPVSLAGEDEDGGRASDEDMVGLSCGYHSMSVDFGPLTRDPV